MTCPHCQTPLAPWPWQDGGYRGLRCDGCGQRWWSDAFAAAACEAEDAAVAALLARSALPADALTDEEWQRLVAAKEDPT